MKTILRFSTFILVAFVFYLLWNDSIDKRVNMNCMDEYSKQVEGFVLDKQVRKNHGSRVLILRNGDTEIEYFCYYMSDIIWQSVEIGNYLSKKSNSFDYVIVNSSKDTVHQASQFMCPD